MTSALLSAAACSGDHPSSRIIGRVRRDFPRPVVRTNSPREALCNIPIAYGAKRPIEDGNASKCGRSKGRWSTELRRRGDRFRPDWARSGVVFWRRSGAGMAIWCGEGRIMMRPFLALLGWIFIGFANALPADAAGRVALVIGNSAYQHAPHLANPANDASA